MKRILLLVGLAVAAALPAQAADYVLVYVNGGTTYYLARNGTSGVQRVNTFDPTTCIWHCASNTAGTTAGTLNNSNTYGYLYQTVNGTRYFLHANATALGLGTNAGNNYYRWRTNGTYVYNRYNNSTPYYINLASGVARNTTATTASNARPYQVTTNNMAEAVTGSLSNPTITPNEAQTVEYNGSVSYTASATGPTRIVPAHTTYAFNNNTFYYYNNQTYTSTNGFATNNPEVTYTWTLTGDGASALELMSTTGENTIVKYTGTATGTTATLTVTAKVGTETRTASVAINVTPVEPTAISATGTTVYMGNSGEVAYTLTPNYAYHRVAAVSGNTGVFTVTSPATTGAVAITPVAPGQATLTLTALNSNGSNGPSTSVTVTVRDICAAPEFSFAQSGSSVLATITTTTPGATIRYTTDGTDPTPTTGTVYSSAPFTVADGTTIKAIAVKGEYYDASAVAAKVVRPMDYVEQGVSGDIVTLNDLEDHTWSYYSDSLCPIRSLGPADVKITYYGNGEKTVSTTNATSPATDSWTANATGVKVNIGGEDENTFVYHKTLERYNSTTTDSYEYGSTAIYGYTTIPNPFQVRPTYGSGDTRWRGFYKWRIKSISNGHIYTTSTKTGEKTAYTSGDYDESNMLDAEKTYYFVPDGEYNMEVELEAMWARAYVTTSTNNLGTYVTGTGAYERNFHVVTSTQNADEYQKSYPLTISAYYPDGSNGGGSVQGYNSGGWYNTYYGFEAAAATKFENIAFNTMDNHTINANNNDLIIGRGCTGTVNYIHGSDATTNNLNYIMRLESGSFNYLSLVKGTYNQDDGGASFSGTSNKVKAIIGCDYDRAKESNTNLTINNEAQYGAGCSFGSANNNRLLTVIVKSGTIGDVDNIGDGSGNYLYLGVSGVADNAKIGLRYITVEGGRIVHLAGGIETGNETDTAFTVRMSGGEIIGALYGAGAFAKAYGHRKYIITGGGIRGWIAGGCNGTTTTNNTSNLGVMYGSTFMYIGGNTEVGFHDGTTPNHVNFSDGGNIFGAGSGNELVNTGSNAEKTRYASVGQVYNSTVVIADNTYVQNNVFGGGNFGYVSADGTNIHILGGTVKNNVFGGSNQRTGTNINIIMKDGLIMGGIYGGSNITGTISNDVTMHINGGQVGTSTTPANIHGGGYGSATAVSGNVDLTLGKTNATSGVTVYGDVYGGSADGSVNDATSDHTYVTLNAGTIYGSLYGGGLGITNANCNVNGPVQVVVNGGSVKKQSSGSNPASIFGCNNAMGSPKSTVTVTVNKTDTTVVDGSGSKAYAINGVYGGGNLAHYNPTTTGDYPTVTVNGCTSSIKDVYGGGNAAAVPYTNVTINGGDIDRVFAGGNGESGTPAHVGYRNTDANPSTNSYGSGNTNATINGGSINQVFGGSNANGVIRGSINVSAQKSGSCDLKVKALYGGGNQAPSNAGNISIGCMTAADMIDTVYGGSNDADISGDISLTMTGGRIGNLFGGNNTGHSIGGDISVEVNWSGSCSDNYLGNVFGGGNMAAYSGGPSVSVLNGTVSGSVYGGGKGSTAVVTGNPTVAIGDNTADHCAIVEGNVYGGGDAAAVSGKSHVTYNDNNAASRVANLFGGGNAASVSDSATVDMTLGQVTHGIYGGCNSSGSVGAATVNLTGGQVGTSESRADIFGGGFGAATTTTAGIDVNVGATTIHGDIYGGSALGSVNASTTDITTVDITGSAVNGKVYGGGKGQADATDTVCATSHGQAIVNIKTANADLDGIYGGANINGLVEGDIEVNVTANTACAVFGGGFGALTATDGDVTVNIGTATGYASAPTISGNVYGGSALGSVNGSTADTTTVNILNGHITGHVFGGGLGHKTYDPDNKDANGVVVYDADSTAAIEKGNVVVNIGSAAQTTYNDTYKGYNNVTVDGMVFGGNDSCGTPLGDVYVNIYHTAHTAADQAHDQSDVDNPGIGAVANLPGEGEGDYALSAVYGGGNLAHYAAAGKKATVHIYGCENTIEYAYGGGNAADVPACELTVEGGDYFQIFGGGNGAVSYLPGANVTEGDATTNVYGGVFTSIFGGSNTKGDIAGEMKLTVDQSKGSCGLEIVGNLYGGGNKAPSKGGNLTVECGEIVLGNVYGGANAAYVDGDVTLTMKGGKDIGYVFGGSRSVATENHIDGYAISGDVTLRLYGGTITNAFGGSDSIGNIKGNIKVLLIDSAIANCPLKVDNVYGGGKDAAYAPADGTATTPAVNVLHGTVNNAVFGGGLGAGATVTANPTVTIGDADKAANHAIVGATKIAGGTGDGNVFGGGSQADVLKSGDGVGNTTVTLTGQADVMGNVYGGGNEADVEGNSKVEMK